MSVRSTPAWISTLARNSTAERCWGPSRRPRIGAANPFEALGIDAIQLPHPDGQIALERLDEQVVVVVHQTVGGAQSLEARHPRG